MKNKSELKLQKILDKVEFSRSYFLENYERFNKFKNLIFNTTLDSGTISALTMTSKPIVEFNIMEAFISRQLGEFFKQEPSFKIHKSYDSSASDPRLLKFLENHLRAILSDEDKSNIQGDIFKDLIAGGFSCAKVYTDYIHNMSFDQKICVERIYDPTLVGFDPNATLSHKGDGEFCYSIHPIPKEIFINTYGNKKVGQVTFKGAFGGYNWSFVGEDKEEYILLCEYFEKKTEKKEIVQLVTGEVMLSSVYEKKKKEWELSFGGIGVFPEIKGKSRKADFDSILRYVVCENEILESMPTDYSYFPLIFIDGNSEMLHKGGSNGSSYQMTRPYVYQCESIQKLKNFAGATLANELENIDQNKYRVPIEGVPETQQNAYANYQKPGVLFYNQFLPEDRTCRLDPPEPLPRVSPPPELAATFSDCDRMMQTALGSYDAAMGINNNELSGEAIMNAANMSNATVIPYIRGYLNGLNRILEVCVDLIPKYYTSERKLPIQTSGRQRTYVKVNGKNAEDIKLDYNPKNITVDVEAGVNFEIQKKQSFFMMQKLASTFPIFAEFIQTDPRGMQMLLDNIDIRGIDDLKDQVPQFIEQKKKEREEQQELMRRESQARLDPLTIKNKELNIRLKNEDARNRVDENKVEIQKTEADTKRMLALNKIGESMDQRELDLAKHQTEKADLDIQETLSFLENQNQIS